MATDYKPMTPKSSAALACTTSSQVIALPYPGENTVELIGDASIAIYVAFGRSTVTAAAPSTSFAADCHPVVGTVVRSFTPSPGDTHMAYRSASATPTLLVTQGFGQ